MNRFCSLLNNLNRLNNFIKQVQNFYVIYK